jgi:single-stranded DNA-binding protein
VTVQGQLSTRSYEKNGQKVWTTEVVADTVANERGGVAQASGGEFDAPEVGGQIISDDCPF